MSRTPRSPLFAIALSAFAALASSVPAAANEFDDCAKLSGNPAIEACNRGINSGRYNKVDLATLYLNRGAEFSAANNLERAIEDFNQALRLDPKRASAYNNRGIAYRRLDKLESALFDFTTAIRLQEHYQFYSNRGLVYDLRGDKDAAFADYNKALVLNPGDAITYYNRGRLFKKSGQSEKAAADFKMVLKINPEHKGAEKELASLSVKQ